MASPAADPTARFFAELAERQHEPRLRKASGSMRFEVVEGRKTRHWVVRIDGGDITVTSANQRADCLVRADKALFDKLATGRANAVAAVLRGDLHVEGDWRFLVRMQRLFPGPKKASR